MAAGSALAPRASWGGVPTSGRDGALRGSLAAARAADAIQGRRIRQHFQVRLRSFLE